MACISGKYSIGKQTKCTDCPTGRYCPTTKSEPIKCLRGYFSYGLQNVCTLCNAGFQCSNPSGMLQHCFYPNAIPDPLSKHRKREVTMIP